MGDERQDCLTRCFAGPFNACIYKLRYVIVAVLAVLGLASAGVASQMGPLSAMESMLPQDHPLMAPSYIMAEEFAIGEGSPSSLEVALTWGVKDMDRRAVGLWESSNPGVLVWDEGFTVAPRRNQAALLNLCDWLERESELVQDGAVNCWIKRMDEFVRRETAKATALPISDEAEFSRYLHRFIDEDPAGIDAYRTQKLGFVPIEDGDTDSEFSVKL